MATQNLQGYEKISWREKICYGLGDPAQNIVYTVCATLMVFFYTDVIGISAASIATIMILSRCLDGVSDVVMGWLLDRTVSKHGKCRCWIMRMTIPYCIGAVLLFCVPPISTMGKLIYIFITYNLVNTIVYTALALAFSTLSSTITRDQEDRAHLTIFRTLFSAFGTLVVSSYSIVFVNRLGGDQAAWIKVIGIYAVIAAILLTVCLLNTKERVSSDTEKPKVHIPFGTQFRILISNKYWWFMFVSYIMYSGYMTLIGTGLTYYSKWILGNDELVAYFQTAHNLPLLFVPLIAIPLLKKISKRSFALFGCILALIGSVIIITSPYNVTIITAASLVRGIGVAAFLSVCWAMLADAVEFGHWKFNLRLEGMIFCACSAALKLGAGLANAVQGFVMEAAGYNGIASVQPESALKVISDILLYSPCITWGITLVMMLLYGVEKIYPKIMADLAEREAKNTENV